MVCAALLVGCACESGPRWPEIGARVPHLPGQSHDGAPFDLRQQPDVPTTLLFFGYTFCPDVCPLTLLTLRRVIEGVGATRPLQVVMVTVDPERDTVGRLATYVEGFPMKLTAVRPTALDTVKTAFKLSVEHTQVEGAADPTMYTVNHTSSIFVVHRGRLVARLAHKTPVPELVAAVKAVIPASHPAPTSSPAPATRPASQPASRPASAPASQPASRPHSTTSTRAARPVEAVPHLSLTEGALTLPPGAGGAAAVYLTLHNRGAPDAVLGATVSGAKHTMLHETVMDGDVAKMVHAERWPLPADARLVLAPGGRHLMVTGLDARPGAPVEVTLQLEAAGPVRFTVTAQPASAPR